MNNLEKISKTVFKYRSYTPIPFLIIMLIFQQATLQSLITGFVIALTGEGFRLWGVSYAGSETRTTGDVGGTYLVISGAFGHVRNPLYLGNILLYVGTGIMSNALFPYLQIIALVFFYIQYRLIIIAEEKYLKGTFGKAYEKYLDAVPRLVPRITKYKDKTVTQPPLNVKAGLRSEKRSLQAFTIITIILIIQYLMN